jgi:hypothetical protein
MKPILLNTPLIGLRRLQMALLLTAGTCSTALAQYPRISPEVAAEAARLNKAAQERADAAWAQAQKVITVKGPGALCHIDMGGAWHDKKRHESFNRLDGGPFVTNAPDDLRGVR